MKDPTTSTSESRNHSNIGALFCVNKILKVMEERISPIKKVIAWSDGMSAHFCSRFTLMLFSTIHQAIHVEWHYNEAHHGKRPMDRAGGTIKNLFFVQ